MCRSGHAVCIMTLAAMSIYADFAIVDTTLEPPGVSSSGGSIVSCSRMADGLLLGVGVSHDVELSLTGMSLDANIGYFILGESGSVLSSGEGLSIPLSEYPDAQYIVLVSQDFDWSTVKQVSNTEKADLATLAAADSPHVSTSDGCMLICRESRLNGKENLLSTNLTTSVVAMQAPPRHVLPFMHARNADDLESSEEFPVVLRSQERSGGVDELSVESLRTDCISPYTRGLGDEIMYHDFREEPVNGIVLDATTNAYDGVASGCVWTNAGRCVGGAMLFHSNSDSVSLAGAPDFPSWDSYSVSIWFLHDGGGDMGAGYGHKMLDKTSWYHDWYIALHAQSGGGGTIGLAIYENGAYNPGLEDSTHNYADGQWHHVVVTRFDTYGQFWVDGELKSETDGMKSVYSSSALCMGNSFSGDSYQRKAWHGMLDELRVYNRALSSTEIRDLYEIGAAGHGTVEVSANLFIGGDLTVNGRTRLSGGAVWHPNAGGLSFGIYTNSAPLHP